MSLTYVFTHEAITTVKNINTSTTPRSFLKPFGIIPSLYSPPPHPQATVDLLSLWTGLSSIFMESYSRYFVSSFFYSKIHPC